MEAAKAGKGLGGRIARDALVVALVGCPKPFPLVARHAFLSLEDRLFFLFRVAPALTSPAVLFLLLRQLAKQGASRFAKENLEVGLWERKKEDPEGRMHGKRNVTTVLDDNDIQLPTKRQASSSRQPRERREPKPSSAALAQSQLNSQANYPAARADDAQSSESMAKEAFDAAFAMRGRLLPNNPHNSAIIKELDEFLKQVATKNLPAPWAKAYLEEMVAYKKTKGKQKVQVHEMKGNSARINQHLEKSLQTYLKLGDKLCLEFNEAHKRYLQEQGVDEASLHHLAAQEKEQIEKSIVEIDAAVAEHTAALVTLLQSRNDLTLRLEGEGGLKEAKGVSLFASPCGRIVFFQHNCSEAEDRLLFPLFESKYSMRNTAFARNKPSHGKFQIFQTVALEDDPLGEQEEGDDEVEEEEEGEEEDEERDSTEGAANTAAVTSLFNFPSTAESRPTAMPRK